ncbi:MAG: TIM barrel protein [Planctomycetota bacterium]
MQRLLDRRDCGLLLAGSLAALALRGKQDSSKGFRLRYVLASCMYGKAPLEEILPEVKKTGAESIDVWPAIHANQREQIEAMGHERFLERLDEAGTRLGILTRFDLGPFGLGEEILVAKKLGAKTIVTGSAGPKDLAGSESRTAVKTFLEKLKPQVAQAEDAGVTIAIENHARALLSTPDSLRHFAELAHSPNLGIAFAPYHLPQDAKLLGALLEEVGAKVVHYYAWQSFAHDPGDPTKNERDQLPGRGPLDFCPMLEALKKIDYRGTTSVFMHPTPRGIPIAETTEEVTRLVNDARRYLDERI